MSIGKETGHHVIRGFAKKNHLILLSIAALVIIAISMVWMGCCRTPVDFPHPNIVLVTMDTLRADHLGCYGYKRNTSSRIDNFAGIATLYPRSFASSPWTLPTHASMFTGLHSTEHGARTFKILEKGQNVKSLAENHPTLAEALKQEGYETAAFVANDGYLNLQWEVHRGFDIYDVELQRADKVNARVFSWLESRDKQQPFFLFINYMDTHGPYNTTPRPGFLPTTAVQDGGQLLKELKQAVLPHPKEFPSELAQKVIDQYDTAIANLDEQIGTLLDRLKEMGVYEDTLIILTSDHGEFLGEHDLVAHSKDVYQEVIWVPTIIKRPRQHDGTVDETVISSVDIPDVVFSMFPRGVRRRHRHLLRYALGDHVVVSENYYTRSWDLFNPVWGKRFNRVRTVVFEWPYKYIESSDGNNELYDIQADPMESINLITHKPELATRLMKKLNRFRRMWKLTPDPRVVKPLSQEERQRLKSLGYLGTSPID